MRDSSLLNIITHAAQYIKDLFMQIFLDAFVKYVIRYIMTFIE